MVKFELVGGPEDGRVSADSNLNPPPPVIYLHPDGIFRFTPVEGALSYTLNRALYKFDGWVSAERGVLWVGDYPPTQEPPS